MYGYLLNYFEIAIRKNSYISRNLARSLSNCDSPMPAEICQLLSLPDNAPYADGVKEWIKRKGFEINPRQHFKMGIRSQI